MPEIVGAMGTPSGVTVVVAAVALVPYSLVAVTETTYVCPLINPVISHVNNVVTHPADVGTVDTEYVNSVEPPKPVGKVHVTTAPESR
jgi:hypothetical protein